MDIDIDVDDQDARSDSGMTAVSSTSNSPAPSMYSFTSSRDGRSLYREIAGRKLNAQNDLYQLPSGKTENRNYGLIGILTIRRFDRRQRTQQIVSPIWPIDAHEGANKA